MKNQILKLTATEAARDFSRLLDRIEAGQEAIIERHGKVIAHISPAMPRPRKASECLAVPWPYPSVTLDPEFAKDLEEIIQGHTIDERDWWESS